MLAYKRRLLPFFKWSLFIITVVVVVLIVAGIFSVYKISTNYKLSPGWIWNIISGKAHLLRQTGNRTNIVMLGIGGDDHDSGDLTDTIMVVSIGLDKKDVVLLSIPRDIWVASLKDKINSAYFYGEEKAKGGGLILAKASVEEVVGIPIHYGAIINFSGFKNIIDVVGGLDVVIAASFTDSEFPIPGKENDECEDDQDFKCRYETITFVKGIEHMDGDRALKFVRSRHAEGDSGTDFSRGRRQQAVLIALKKKLLLKSTWANLKTVRSVYASFQSAITTDLFLGESLLLARVTGFDPDIDAYGLTQDNLDDGKPGLLINPPLWKYDGRWVLVPKHDEDYSQIHVFTKCILNHSLDCDRFLN